ncbi:ExeA family protein [Thermicanus aegyptius]|uniref:ExeA family protein n=1 Tax=Thermicanus aegyptius TaxID=94009 RepID=UPI00042A2C3C|nr:AAA family ATPase [Thermicanus aegyptius]
MRPEERWGWVSMPFRRETEPTGWVETAKQKEALARLHVMVDRGYLGVLTGEIGSGKTTLIRRFVHELNPLTYHPIYLSMSGLKPKDFYGEILRHLGEEAPFSSVKAKRLFQERVEQRSSQGEKQLVVIVDEAQDLSDMMILELRFVMNHQMDAKSLFPLILVGQPELRKRIRLRKYEAIWQRIGLSYHIGGLTEEESIVYIRHQMKQVGAGMPVFSDSAVHLIHGASQGIPRIINQICTQAIYDAALNGHEVIEDKHIHRVLIDQQLQRGAV